jgi:hypothetical protein
MLANAFLISKLKVFMQGKKFWFRTILSSGFSEIVLCTVAYFVLFTGFKTVSEIVVIIYCVWSYKVVFTIFAAPLVSLLGKWLKRVENSDVYDINISYSPLQVFYDETDNIRLTYPPLQVCHYSFKTANDEIFKEEAL